MSEIDIIQRAHINLRGDPGGQRFLDAAAAALGQALPTAANTFTGDDPRLCWLGPDEWLISAAPERAQPLVESLETQLAGLHVAINDLSGGHVSLHLSGAGAAERLAAGCTLDLHPAVFATGQCAQTGLAKANVLIACIDTAPVYEIIVRRSFSEYLLRWLRKNLPSRDDSASC